MILCPPLFCIVICQRPDKVRELSGPIKSQNMRRLPNCLCYCNSFGVVVDNRFYSIIPASLSNNLKILIENSKNVFVWLRIYHVISANNCDWNMVCEAFILYWCMLECEDVVETGIFFAGLRRGFSFLSLNRVIHCQYHTDWFIGIVVNQTPLFRLVAAESFDSVSFCW